MTDFAKYHKINGVMKRYTEGPKKGRFIWGDWARDEFETLKDCPWLWREKIDGTNIRIHVQKDAESSTPQVSYGGRTDNAQIPASLFARLRTLFDEADYEAVFGDALEGGVILYGEGFGAGIQKAGASYGPVDFILFDVRIGHMWLEEDAITSIAGALGIKRVPIIGTETLTNMLASMQVLEPTEVSEFDGVTCEGCVGYPVGGLLNRRGERIITKLKFVDFADYN